VIVLGSAASESGTRLVLADTVTRSSWVAVAAMAELEARASAKLMASGERTNM